MNVLLSIKPKYAEEILAGKKKYEFRKLIFKKKSINKIFIYSSSPTKKIIGSCEIAKIITESPQNLWQICHKEGGISETDFFEYFNNSEVGYAIEIANLHVFLPPIDPYSSIKNFKPPQSFCYIPHDFLQNKMNNKCSEKILEESNFEHFSEFDCDRNDNGISKKSQLPEGRKS